MSKTLRWRKAVNAAMWGVTIGCALAILIPLISVLAYVALRGAGGLNVDFFLHTQAPVGEPGGGMAHALVGSLIVVGLACTVSIPLGVIGGIYLSEFGDTRFGWWVRFAADVLTGTPSIVAGAFSYALVVLPMGRPSALAGATALMLLMVPMVTRTTEEMLRLVPSSQRDASLAVGATRASTVFGVLLPAALPGVVTGILLAVARVAGETAPLLHTAMSNLHFSTAIDQPIATLPVQIYTYALSPYDDWQQQAWAGALVLVLLVLVLSIAARWATHGRVRSTP